MKKAFKTRTTVELEQLLHGHCTPTEVSEFFRNGEFYEEHYLVAAIKRHLLTDIQKKELAARDISIEDVLNGRTVYEQFITNLFNEWNQKLGFKSFGV